MERTEIIKKNLQKTTGLIRKDMNSRFPKAMMTGQQMMKNTATVNCGGEWCTAEQTKAKADAVMDDIRFIRFLSDNGCTAKLELNSFGTYQIRINY